MTIYDVDVTLNVVVGVSADSSEDAQKKLDALPTEDLIQLIQEQQHFIPKDNVVQSAH